MISSPAGGKEPELGRLLAGGREEKEMLLRGREVHLLLGLLTEHADAVVDGDDDDASEGGQGAAVVQGRAAPGEALVVLRAVDEDHHRK